MRLTTLLLCLLSFPEILLSQETEQRVIKNNWLISKTWIHLKDNPSVLRGVLYEIKDSSVLVSNSLLKTDYINNNFSLVNIYYKDINEIYTRKKNKVVAGTLIGSAAGFVIAYGIVKEAVAKDEFTGAMAILGIPAVSICGGFGALISAFRIKIPINNNFESFKINESRLKRHSYINEYSAGPIIYEESHEHKWFLGLTMNMSIPSGDFEERLPANISGNLSKTGGSLNMILGYSIKDNFGLTASFQNSSYNFTNTTSEDFWSLMSVVAGPLYSIPIRDKLILNLKPMIGYANSSIVASGISADSGEGFGIYPSVALMYNFSDRWSAMGESGYLFTNQKFEDGNRKMNAYNLGAGIAYRFK